MADFNTHLIGATASGSIAATVVAKVLGTSPEQAAMLAGATVIGGILPDIDLQKSTPSRLLFTALGLVIATVWAFTQISHYSAMTAWGAALGLFIVVRGPVAWLFGSLTVHRGALHSLLAACTAMITTTAVAYQVCHAPAPLAWLLGSFTALGYLVHLTMDELWSVDFTGARIKRSFGSALKPLDIQRWPGSAALLVIAFAASLLLPPMEPFYAMASQLTAAILAGTPGQILPMTNL